MTPAAIALGILALIGLLFTGAVLWAASVIAGRPDKTQERK